MELTVWSTSIEVIVSKVKLYISGKFHSTLLRDKAMLNEIEEANFDIVIIDNFFLHRNFLSDTS